MAVKKKPTPKKNTKPAASKKPVAKKAPAKAAQPAAKKPAPKKTAPVKAAAKKIAPAKPAANKSAPQKAAPAKHAPKKAATVVAKKPTSTKTAPVKAAIVGKVTPKPATASAAKPVPMPLRLPMPKKGNPLSFVSIKAKVKSVTKKEPPKPTKVVIPKTTTKSAVKYEPDFTKSILDANKVEAAQAGPSQRYSDADLNEFREIIVRKLDAAKKELNYLQGLITRRDEGGGDMDDARYMTMEDGSVSMEREQLSQMASRQITFIDHLEKALMRIENKTYGICRVTGKLVDKDRLRAVPHATLSIEAKQMINK